VLAGPHHVDSSELREGIFNLHTRRLGSVAEIIVKRLANLQWSRDLTHDLYDPERRERVEVKFSRVLKKSTLSVSEATVLESIGSATSEQRMVRFAEWEACRFDCNIQQVKRQEFDVLYYGLFFADAVVVFRIRSNEIGPDIYYSDLQHRGNIGEGQFHVNNDTLAVHLARYLYRKLTYEELLRLLSPRS